MGAAPGKSSSKYFFARQVESCEEVQQTEERKGCGSRLCSTKTASHFDSGPEGQVSRQESKSKRSFETQCCQGM
jgi:hypothetical protein